MPTQAEIDAAYRQGDVERRLQQLETRMAQLMDAGLDRLVQAGYLQFDNVPLRMDNYGLQIQQNAGVSVRALRYVGAFRLNDSIDNSFFVSAYIDEGVGNVIAGSLGAQVDSSNQSVINFNQALDKSSSIVTIQAERQAGATVNLTVESGTSGERVGITLAPLNLANMLGATPAGGFIDGDIWYEGIPDKFKGHANSTTETFAFESYVDAAVAAPSTTWALTGDITPSQITANQNDYNPTGLSTASVLRLSSDASRDITGIAGGFSGRVLIIFNVGSNNIVLKDESASSTAANRFALNGDITLAADNSVILWYDATSSRWRAV